MAVVVGTIPFGFLEGVVPAPVFGFDFVELTRGSLLVRVMDRANETQTSERYQLYLRLCRLDTMQAMAFTT